MIDISLTSFYGLRCEEFTPEFKEKYNEIVKKRCEERKKQIDSEKSEFEAMVQEALAK